MSMIPNERTSGNGAIALLLHAQPPGCAVPECERFGNAVA
jgi:hypothetical protein